LSDKPNGRIFKPRPVQTSTDRATGREWLNEPLVRVIDELHQPMYLFPRDCPGVLYWPTSTTTPEDCERWWGEQSRRVVARVERTWLDRLRTGILHGYEFLETDFMNLHDAGTWVYHVPVTPIRVETLRDLIGGIARQGVELRVMASLVSLKELSKTPLHVSGLRLRNARD